jgi:DNA (cytosine-5)-methyltransferase 1
MSMSLNTDALNVDLSLTMTNPHAWNLTDLEGIPKNGLKVFSTFSCGGGSSLGYKLAGCDVIAANDIDPEMAYHYRLNLDPKYYFLCPIKDLLTKEVPEELYGIDLLDGSPPCSTFSMAGSREKAWGKNKKFREGQATQILDDLFFDYLNLVDRLKPKVAIAENVKGMLVGNAKGYVKMIMDRFKEIGYRPQLFLVNAADCGVPQKRERVFFCAIRDDIEAPKLTLNLQHRWISAGEATSDVQELTEAERVDTRPARCYAEFWKNTEAGKDFSKEYFKKTKKRGYFAGKILNPADPSFGLTAQDQHFFSWSECRILTFREWKRLGSFPDDYRAKTDKIGKYMIGMSVPPKMTAAIAKEAIKQWFNL